MGLAKVGGAGYAFFSLCVIVFGCIAVGTPSWVNESNPQTSAQVFGNTNITSFWSGLFWLTVQGNNGQQSFKVTDCPSGFSWTWTGWHYIVSFQWTSCSRYYAASMACFALQITGIILAFFTMIPALAALKRGGGIVMGSCFAFAGAFIFTCMLAGILTWYVWVYQYYFPQASFGYSYILSATATSCAGMLMLFALLMCGRDRGSEAGKHVEVV